MKFITINKNIKLLTIWEDDAINYVELIEFLICKNLNINTDIKIKNNNLIKSSINVLKNLTTNKLKVCSKNNRGTFIYSIDKEYIQPVIIYKDFLILNLYNIVYNQDTINTYMIILLYIIKNING